jgi:hypothetical protein
MKQPKPKFRAVTQIPGYKPMVWAVHEQIGVVRSSLTRALNRQPAAQGKTQTFKNGEWVDMNDGIPQMAIVCTNGWVGRIDTPVTVTRETPKRYECEYTDGRRKLVPKYAVRFTPNAKVRVSE